MATLKIKNLKQVQTSLRKKITKEMRSKAVRTGVAEIVVDGIQDTNYGSPAKLTKEMREYLEPHNSLDPKYRRNKLNMTFTGELLKDLIKNVKARFKTGTATFIIEHSNRGHKPYKQPSDTGKGRKTEVTSLKSRKTRDVRDRFSKSTFQNAGGRKNRIKVPYSFISTQLIKRLGYDYLKISGATQKKVIEFIKKEVFRKLK